MHACVQMCFSEAVGALVVGGAVPSAPLGVPWIPISSTSSYVVHVEDFTINGASQDHTWCTPTLCTLH